MEANIIIALVITTIILAFVQVITTKVSVKSQRMHTGAVYKLYKELKRFNDESDAMFNVDSDDIKNIGKRVFGNENNEMDRLNDLFQQYKMFGYATFEFTNFYILLNHNKDDRTGIILLPKNQYEPVLLPQYKEIEVEWIDARNLEGAQYYTSVNTDISKEFCSELILANQLKKEGKV